MIEKKNQPFFWSDLLRQRQLFHTTYKMYMVSLGLWTFSLFLYSIAYGKYANTGYKETGTEYAGTWIKRSDKQNLKKNIKTFRVLVYFERRFEFLLLEW